MRRFAISEPVTTSISISQTTPMAEWTSTATAMAAGKWTFRTVCSFHFIWVVPPQYTKIMALPLALCTKGIHLNVASECGCSGWADCIEPVGIYCDSYDVNITDGEFTSYSSFVRVTDGDCSDPDRCGCSVFVDRISNDFDGSCPNPTDSSDFDTTGAALEMDYAVDTTTGTVMAVIMTLAAVLFLLYFCLNRKYQRQVQSTRFRTATRGMPSVGAPVDEFEEEPSVSIIEDDGVPTKR